MLNLFTQKEWFLQLDSPLNEGELILMEFSGYESLSSPFKFSLHMQSENKEIAPEKLLHNPVTIQLNPNRDSEPRYFHGIISQFYGGTITGSTRYYFADIQPWLAFLNYSTDCRIFQNKNIIDILEIIFQEFGFHDYDTSSITRGNYKKRDYCVQYQETTLNFIQRLLEEEAIFYFFKHEKNKHTLTLGEKSSAFKKCVEFDVKLTTESDKKCCLTKWQRHYKFYPGKFTQQDYNFETPDVSLPGKQENKAKLALAEKYELFHYPGKHQTTADGKKAAQNHFEAQEAHYDSITGEGNYITFSAAGKFTLSEATIPSDNGDYILTTVLHHATNNTYVNQFSCIPSTTPYRPIPHTIKPVIFSIQSAVVVGPSGEELYTDKYGRVKVQFYWDRKGKKDDFSSCWVRVAQSWAGKQWGTLFMPRIGQEVIVQFLEGDPDRPIITGSVYNANNLPPYQLPFEQTRSGIKTRSTKGGGINDFNELRFEDKAGQEEIYIHAQKDFTRVIENDEKVIIKKGKSTLEAAQAIELKVGDNSIIINTQGVFINGQQVEINKG